MKPIYLVLGMLFLYGQVVSQKNPSTLASNLNLSKSNINRLIYPSTLVTQANAELLLVDVEKMGPTDPVILKNWLTANFKRFGIESKQVKQISIYTGRQYADCRNCEKNCKGRCVQDPGADCVCISHSEPNVRTAQAERTVTFIFLCTEMIDDATAMDLVATTVKSSKSNSSE